MVGQLLAAEHFTAPPDWKWYILLYFFFAGISGGAYALGTLLRLVGDRRDQAGSRVAFLVSWPVLLACPLLLTVDLGKPIRFWHMLVDSRTGAPAFKIYSPMSLGAWALTIFGIFATVSFFEALVLDGRIRHGLGDRLAAILRGGFGRIFMIVGSFFGLFVAGYTGVLLSVSNQPVWSDAWPLGGLFLASGLSAAAATIGLFAWYRRDARDTAERLSEADRYFIIMELILVAVFLLTLGSLASRVATGLYGVLFWVIVVLLGMAVPLAIHYRPALAQRISPSPIVSTVLVLVGVLVLRAVVIFSAQT